MTERRAHWDIDLVDGVGRRLIPLYRSIGYCVSGRIAKWDMCPSCWKWFIKSMDGEE